jgi:predicted  nucleic acid-binding Zn-ribbon protein
LIDFLDGLINKIVHEQLSVTTETKTSSLTSEVGTLRDQLQRANTELESMRQRLEDTNAAAVAYRNQTHDSVTKHIDNVTTEKKEWETKFTSLYQQYQEMKSSTAGITPYTCWSYPTTSVDTVAFI